MSYLIAKTTHRDIRKPNNILCRLTTLGLLILWDFYSFSVAAAPTHVPDSIAVQEGVLDISAWDTSRQASISLAGNWYFLPETLLQPAELIDRENSLHPILLPVKTSWNSAFKGNWPSHGHGIGTYWLSFKGTPPAQSISLNISRSCSSANIYFFSDHQAPSLPLSTLGSVGKDRGSSSPYAGSRQLKLPFSSAKTHHLLIQVANFDFNHGGLCGELQLGTEAAISNQHFKDIINRSMLIALTIIASLYLLGLYSQNYRNQQTLWFTILCFSTCAFFLAASGLLEIITNVRQGWLFELRIKLIYLGISWASVAFNQFYRRLFGSPLPAKIALANCCLTGVLSLFFIIGSAAQITAITYPLLAYWGLQFAITLMLLGRAYYKRMPYARGMLVAIIPLAAALPYDVLNETHLNQMPLLSLSCLVFYIFVHCLILGRKFSDATRLAEQLSSNLMDEVAQRTSELHDKNQKLERVRLDLEQANEALKKLSITDGLTRVYNRLYFDQELRKEWRRSSRLRKPVSILMIDVDHFKRLNDSAGHLAGDQALQYIARCLHQHFKRAGELVARYGGEEFVVLLPHTEQAQAVSVADELRQIIASEDICYDGHCYRISVSIGVSSTVPSMRLAPEDLLRAADAALYKAKNSGRNRVENIPLLPSKPYPSDGSGAP